LFCNQLSSGTAALGMRFGLHSGPVTAGVLRGEKSRFQLFGDTINVVSCASSLSFFHLYSCSIVHDCFSCSLMQGFPNGEHGQEEYDPSVTGHS
jgi:hypothetical protein